MVRRNNGNLESDNGISRQLPNSKSRGAALHSENFPLPSWICGLGSRKVFPLGSELGLSAPVTDIDRWVDAPRPHDVRTRPVLSHLMV